MKNKIISKIESSLVEFSLGHLILEDRDPKLLLEAEMSKYKVPGLSIAVIDDNEVDWVKGYGLLRNGNEKKVTPETIFQACSISKMVTTPLILHLVENETFDLDTNVNQYLTSWQVPASDFTKERKVTLRGLLTHQSGISRPDGGYNWEVGTEPTLVQILNAEFPAVMKPTLVEFEPFSKWQYSNVGFDIIQLILEDYYGKPFVQISRELLFNPLEMGSSTFQYPLPSDLAKREISLHDKDGTPTHPGIIPSAEAHGSLMTTATDLAKFGIALMRAFQGETLGIITPSLVHNMFEQRTWVADTSEMGLAFGMGFGCFLVKEGSTKLVFHPGGNDPGASSLICLIPDKGVGAVLMTNGIRGLEFSVEVLAAIAHAYRWI